LGVYFVANALLAEFIEMKIFSLENTFGSSAVNISLFGFKNLTDNLSDGVLLWPVVFIMTDINNEFFRRRGVRIMSFIAAGLIVYIFFMLLLSIVLTPSDFWKG